MFTLGSHQKNRALLSRVYLLPFAWVLVVLILATRYAYPQTDDFCTFGRLFGPSNNNPFIESWNIYHSWTGRYTSTFLITVFGWISSVIPVPLQWTYRGGLVLMLATYVGACAFLCRKILKGREASLALIMIVVTSTLVLMPSKLEEFLWLTGAAVYFFSISMLLLLMGLIDTDECGIDKSRDVAFRWSMVALIIGGVGTNEFIGLAIGGFLFLRFILYTRTREYRKQNIAYFVAYLVAMGVTIFAPGNFARDSTISAPHHSLQEAIGLSIGSLSNFIDVYIRPNKFLLFSIFFSSFLVGLCSRREPDLRDRRGLLKILSISLTLLASFPMHLLVYSYLAGEGTPGRILNEAYPLALIGVCLPACYAGSRLQFRQTVPLVILVRLSVCVVGILLLSSIQFRQVVSGIRDFGPVWNAEQLNRIDLLSKASGKNKPMVVPAFSREGITPPLLQGGDITGDKNYWINMCVAGYYSVPSVESSPRE